MHKDIKLWNNRYGTEIVRVMGKTKQKNELHQCIVSTLKR